MHALAQVAHLKVRRRPGDAKVLLRPFEISLGSMIGCRLTSTFSQLRRRTRVSCAAQRDGADLSLPGLDAAHGIRQAIRLVGKDDLNVEAMSERRLHCGTHDFAAFSERDRAGISQPWSSSNRWR